MFSISKHTGFVCRIFKYLSILLIIYHDHKTPSQYYLSSFIWPARSASFHLFDPLYALIHSFSFCDSLWTDRHGRTSYQWVYRSPERPAPWVTQLLLMGLSRQVNRTFANYSCGSSYECTWRDKHRAVRGSEGKNRWRRLVRGRRRHGLTLSSESLTEDHRCASLYGLDSCSANSLQEGTVHLVIQNLTKFIKAVPGYAQVHSCLCINGKPLKKDIDGSEAAEICTTTEVQH